MSESTAAAGKPSPAAAIHSMVEKRWVRTLLLFSPVAFALLIAAPRIAAAEFGILDDGETLRVSRGILNGNWNIIQKEESSGRFRPLYWIQYVAIYTVAGADPTWFFVGQALLFAGLTFELILLVRRMGGGRSQAWATGFLFVLSGPVIENVYTLSKPELLQAVFLVGALILFASHKPRPVKPSRLASAAGFCAVLILLATLTKETAAVMIPITAAWLISALVGFRGITRKVEAARWGSLFVGSTVAVLVYFALREMFLDIPITEGTYSNNFDISVAGLRSSAIRWLGWLIRDFAWFLPLLLVPILGVRRRKLKHARLLIGALIWIMAWTALYLPWEFAVEYYMLPLALGVAVAAVAILSTAIQPVWSRFERTALWIVLGLAALLWLPTIPNNLSNARQQLAIDDVNANLIRYLTAEVAPGETVIVNIQFENEYVYGIWRHLQTPSNPTGIDIDIFDARLGLPAEPAWIATPELVNQPRLAVRMGVIEDTQNGWNQSLAGAMGNHIQPVYQVDREFGLSIIDVPRALCPLVSETSYCQVESPFIDTRDFIYGWKVYFWNGA